MAAENRTVERARRPARGNPTSKSLAPGYRLGWCVPGRALGRVERLKLMTSIATSIPIQDGIAEYLKHGGFDHHLRALRRALQAQRGRMLAAVAAHFPPGTRATSPEMSGFMDRLMQPDVLRAVQRLKPIAEEAGLTLPQFALAWVLRKPNVASAIIGASRPSQVQENAAASGVVVDTQLFMRAEAIIEEALGRVEA